MKKIIIILFLAIVICSCQPIEKIDQVVFDNNQLAQFNIISDSIEITENFEHKISNPYIGHTLKINPSQRIINWVNDNFKPIGNENYFNVTILDASLTQIQFENKEANNFNEKNNYKYELFYLVEYSLFDDYYNVLASTLVETSRSTTSGLYISIHEKENIINDLIYQGLLDISNESEKLLSEYMGDFII